MRYFERVVVGLAHQPVDADVLRYARVIQEMGQGRTEVTFVHVLPPPDAVALHDIPLLSLSEVRGELDTTVVREFGTGHQRVEVVSGSHVDVLLTHAVEQAADLVMVGHRRVARGRRSLSRRLATKAPCSVWMVPEGSRPHLTGVLAAVDLSLPSAHALSLATLVAHRSGLDRCTALHVQPPARLGLAETDRDMATRALHRFMSPLDLHQSAVDPRIEEAGSVAGAVAAVVAEGRHDLVVVGTRGRSQSAATLLGSESEHVLVASPVPVLITKETGERIGVVRALLDRDLQPRYEPRFG
jgi:nucleotide-binding universal stress UspA family protein